MVFLAKLSEHFKVLQGKEKGVGRLGRRHTPR